MLAERLEKVEESRDERRFSVGSALLETASLFQELLQAALTEAAFSQLSGERLPPHPKAAAERQRLRWTSSKRVPKRRAVGGDALRMHCG